MISEIKEKLITFLRRTRNLLLRGQFQSLSIDCNISPKVIFWGKSGISIESGVNIQPYAILQCTSWNKLNRSAGSIKIGKGTSIQPFAYISSGGGSIEIGEMCSVNPYCILYGSTGGLKIGNYVRIAAHTVIVPSNHKFDKTSTPIFLQGNSAKGIVIQDDVWIGAGVRIMDGVTIGEGAVIGAGAVVTSNVPPYSVNVGVPANVIYMRKNTNPVE